MSLMVWVFPPAGPRPKTITDACVPACFHFQMDEVLSRMGSLEARPSTRQMRFTLGPTLSWVLARLPFPPLPFPMDVTRSMHTVVAQFTNLMQTLVTHFFPRHVDRDVL